MLDKSLLYRFSNYLRVYKSDLVVVMLALLCVAISLLAIGSAFRQLIDTGIKNHHNLQLINKSILNISILISIFSVGSFFRSYFINNIAEKIVNQIRQEAYNNIINLNIACFEELKVGDILSRLSIDIELVCKLIINFLSFFVRNSIMLIGSIVLMFWQSPKLALLATLIIPLFLLPLSIFAKYVKKLSKDALKSQADIIANLQETISNIAVVQAFNQQENKITIFNKQISNYLQHAAKRLKIRSIFFAIAISMILFSITIVIWVGSHDIAGGNLSSGQMISFIYYAIVSGVSSGGIFEMLSESHLSIAASERVFALIDHPSEKQYDNGQKFDYQDDTLRLNPIIEFRNVSFIYPSRLNNIVIDGLSFSIDKGKFIGMAGRSGAGKSTIMQLMLKFYSPKNGIIKIANQDISQVNDSQLRRLIAYVPQDSSIFSGTIRSNIAFAKPDASEEEIMKAADATGIIDFAQTLKEGLDTKIGERGIRLSGGQKQRIAISRAILHNPEILLLDEAMSALDSDNEQTLLNRLRKLMQGKTILSIAHRISSIEQADEILVIDHGKLIARGTHASLLAQCEIYRVYIN